tara:strand:+ start:1792 stop:2304 length:513 start_codon:yes stop_codon:yes gene_type:complete
MKQYKKTPANIVKQFKRPQFKIGDWVYFTWLGSKQQGYVKKITTQNYGVQYLVVAEEYGKTYKYPCGIEIKGYRTPYDVGCILREESKKLLKDRGRAIDEGRNDNKSRNQDVYGNNSKTTTSRNISRESVNESSSTRISKGSGKQRQDNTELKDAIQKQKDFLNGFVKKE